VTTQRGAGEGARPLTGCPSETKVKSKNKLTVIYIDDAAAPTGKELASEGD
jgi:hypothetical protein